MEQIIVPSDLYHYRLAQLVKYLILKQESVGSNPTQTANQIIDWGNNYSGNGCNRRTIEFIDIHDGIAIERKVHDVYQEIVNKWVEA